MNGEKKVHGSSALSAALKSQHAAATAAAAHGQKAPTTAVHPLDFRSTQQPSSTLLLPSPSSSLQPCGSPQHSGAAPTAGGRLPRILPFWSCFTSAGAVADEDVRRQCKSMVVSAEVGIRPSFYWLDKTASDVSDEERMYAEANARWLKSDCQDDVVVVPNFANVPSQVFAGVFDGHGPYGRLAAKYASTQLPALLASSSAMTSRSSHKKRLRAMRDACGAVDDGMRDADVCGFDASLSGTTACFVVVHGRKLYLANTGDSRCVLARRNAAGAADAVQMTFDAKPDHPEELKRIRMSGGVVQQLLDESGERVGAHRVFSHRDDVLPGLAMSRSLGDLYAHTVGVTNEPVLSSYVLGNRDLFLVLGTDGLWDIMSNEAVVDFIERYRNGRAQDLSCAEALTLEAQERWKARHEEALVDDISVAIIHLAPLPPVDRSARVRSPLAHAASCNDEANALFHSWQLDADRNPSFHAPRSYFSHLYQDGEDEELGAAQEGSGGSTAAVAACEEDSSHHRGSTQASVDANRGEGVLRLRRGYTDTGTALPSASAAKVQRRELPAVDYDAAPIHTASLPRSGNAGGNAGGSLSADALSEDARFVAGAGAVAAAGQMAAAGAGSAPGHCASQHSELAFPPAALAAHLATPAEEPSPRSSLDCSESDTCDGRPPGGGWGGSSKFTGAFARSPSVKSTKMLGQVRSSPIPCGSHTAVDPLLRPIRKAYPSQSGGMCSFKSDASILCQETPRSGVMEEDEGSGSRGSNASRNFGPGCEGKVRGGLLRTISAPILANSRLPSIDAPMLSSSMQAVSLEDHVLANTQISASFCVAQDSPTTDSSRQSSPLPMLAALSPVGHPLTGSLPSAQFPPSHLSLPSGGSGMSSVKLTMAQAAGVGRPGFPGGSGSSGSGSGGFPYAAPPLPAGSNGLVRSISEAAAQHASAGLGI